MKILYLSIIVISVIYGIVMITTTNLTFAEQSPIIITQVELWGPTSFYAGGVKLCGYNETALGPWTIGWVELHNTKNETMEINDVDLRGGSWEEGQFPMTLGPNEYCYIGTQGPISTRIGVGGSLGNGSPPHENSTTTLSYSIQTDKGKTAHKYSTPEFSDSFADTRTWQLVDGNWIFKEANIKQEFPTKLSILSPLKQFQSRIDVKDLKCKEGLVVVVKKSNNSPACVKPFTASTLIERGWGVQEQTMAIQNTNFTINYHIFSGKLDQIVPESGTHGVKLSLAATNDGKITLFLPRSFVDTPEIGDYTVFNVTIDGKKVDYLQHLTPTDRMFVISFKGGTQSIEIIPHPSHDNNMTQ